MVIVMVIVMVMVMVIVMVIVIEAACNKKNRPCHHDRSGLQLKI